MTFQGDPHRTLGISTTASLNEIKSAYRRLVKQYHPDAAGERALPRFLAIQAAYERLVDGEGRLRVAGSSRPTRASAPRPQETWRADPNRARASRDAWRARRSGAPGSSGEADGPARSRTKGRSSGSGAAAGASGAGDRAQGDEGGSSTSREPGRSTGADAGGRQRTHREHHARRGPRTATPGSTSYDEAASIPLDPEWEGGAWYGPSSGTYWTINPREYADPRKHGPEYQARARKARVAGEDATGFGAADESHFAHFTSPPAAGPAAPEPTASTRATEDRSRWRWRASVPGAAGSGASTTDGGAEWGTHAWRYDPPDPVGTARERTHRGTGTHTGGRDRAARPADPDPLPDLESIARRFGPRHLLALARGGDWRWRLAIALTAWPPIGYAVGTLVSESTGCAALSPSCPEPLTLLPIALQPLVIAALFLAPPVATVAAFAGIVALAAALPIAAVLSVGSPPESRVGPTVLGVLVAAAYFVGLAWGANAVWRTAPATAEPADNRDAQPGHGSDDAAP